MTPLKIALRGRQAGNRAIKAAALRPGLRVSSSSRRSSSPRYPLRPPRRLLRASFSGADRRAGTLLRLVACSPGCVAVGLLCPRSGLALSAVCCAGLRMPLAGAPVSLALAGRPWRQNHRPCSRLKPQPAPMPFNLVALVRMSHAVDASCWRSPMPLMLGSLVCSPPSGARMNSVRQPADPVRVLRPSVVGSPPWRWCSLCLWACALLGLW